MENKLSHHSETIFEQIKLIDENKNEYWSAKSLNVTNRFSVKCPLFKSTLSKTGLSDAVAFCRAPANLPGCQGATRASLIPVAQRTAGYRTPFCT